MVEHTPAYQNLVKVPTTPTSELQSLIAGGCWLTDEIALKEVITTTTANLAACNTETIVGDDFKHAQELMKDLFQDLIDSGDVEFHTIPQWRSGRKAILIAPSELNAQMQEVISINSSPNPEDSIEIDHPIVHFHLDTVPASNSLLAGLETYVNPNTGLVYARGSNDMKGVAALAPLLCRKMIAMGYKPPVFMITVDEEIGGSFGGKQLAASLRSSKAFIDWEPIAGFSGTYVDEISEVLGVEMDLVDSITKKHIEAAARILRDQYDPICRPFVSTNWRTISLTVDPKLVTDSEFKTISILAAVARKAGVPISSNESEYVKLSRPGRSSILSKSLTKIISGSLSRNTHFVKHEITPTHISKADVDNKWLSRRAVLKGRYDAIGYFSGNRQNYFILGPHEAGDGRHSARSEAVLVGDLIGVLNSTADILVALAA